MHPSGTNFPRTARSQLWRAVFALSLLAPTGAAAESQILNDTANGPHPVLDWPKDFHIGVTRIEHAACAEGQSKCHESLVIKHAQGVSWRFRHARSKLCNLGGRAPRFAAPRIVLSPGPDQCLKARQSTHSKSEPAPRNSLSLS